MQLGARVARTIELDDSDEVNPVNCASSDDVSAVGSRTSTVSYLSS